MPASDLNFNPRNTIVYSSQLNFLPSLELKQICSFLDRQ